MYEQQLIPRVGVGSLSSPLEVDADRAQKAAEELENILKENKCDVVQLGPINTPGQAVAGGRRPAEEHVAAIVLTPVSSPEKPIASRPHWHGGKSYQRHDAYIAERVHG